MQVLVILRLWEFDSPRPHNRFSPLWFAVRRTRLPALFVGLGMHAMIGPMFGPVVWFALLMAGLLVRQLCARALGLPTFPDGARTSSGRATARRLRTSEDVSCSPGDRTSRGIRMRGLFGTDESCIMMQLLTDLIAAARFFATSAIHAADHAACGQSPHPN